MRRSWVQCLTGESRSHMPHGVAKKIKEYMILSSKEWNTDIRCNMDDPRKHGSTWRKPDTKDPMYSSAAAAAKSLQSCLTLRPHRRQAAHQALPSLGFSRQEHWSGLPFPSPMHESEKWSRSVVSDSLQPHGLQPTRLLRPWDFPGKSTGVGCHCLLRFIC